MYEALGVDYTFENMTSQGRIRVVEKGRAIKELLA